MTIKIKRIINWDNDKFLILEVTVLLFKPISAYFSFLALHNFDQNVGEWYIKPYNSLPLLFLVLLKRAKITSYAYIWDRLSLCRGYCKHTHEVIRWNFLVTRTLTNIDFSIVIIIGGYLVHIQYNVVSSNTKLYLFIRVVK